MCACAGPRLGSVKNNGAMLLVSCSGECLRLPNLSKLHEELSSVQAMVKKMLVNPAKKEDKTAKTDYFKIGLVTEDVLYSEFLPTFNSSINFEEAEKLLSYCAVPQIMIPLVLSFFESRVQLLLNKELASLLQAILFECNNFLATSGLPITHTPVPPELRTDLLGTPQGVLMNDLKHIPQALLAQVDSICQNCDKLCRQGNIDSPFLGLLGFVIRIVVNIETFCSLASEQEPSPARRSLRTWLQGNAKIKLLQWLDEAKIAGDLHSECFLHAHLFLAASTVIGYQQRAIDGNYHDIVSDFFCSSIFLSTWCVNITLDEDPRHVSKYLLRKVFAVLQNLKDKAIDAVEEMSKSDGNEFERIMDKITAVALGRKTMQEADQSYPMMGQKSWSKHDALDISCERIYESPHKYSPCSDLFDSVSFPGASFIEVTFDINTSTQDDDFLTFYKDDSFSEYWGAVRKYSGNDASRWPGCQGKPPLLIPADHFYLHFHSGPGLQDWGYKFTARAPVCTEAVKQLKKSVHENSTIIKKGADLTLEVACKLALKFMHNSVELAETFLHASYEDLEKQSDLIQYEASKKSKGIYERIELQQSDCCSVVLNLQTCHVSISGQSLQPVPEFMKNHTEFIDVFGLRVKDAKQVMVSSKTNFEHVEQFHIEHDRMTYSCEVWNPLVAKDTAQLQMDQNRRDWRHRFDTPGTTAMNWDILDLAGLDTTFAVPDLPVRQGESKDLLFLGHIFKWVTVDLENPIPTLELPSSEHDLPSLHWIESFLLQFKRTFQGKSTRSPPQIWVRSGSAQTTNTVTETKARCRISDGDVPPLLMYTPAESNGTGCFCEIFKVGQDVHVFALLLKGRSVVRSLLYASNGDTSLSKPNCNLAGADSLVFESYRPSWQYIVANNPDDKLWLPGCLFAAGSMRVQTDGDQNTAPSLLISRQRYAPRVELERRPNMLGVRETYKLDQWETYVSVDCLYGLMPEALLDAYKFWKCGRLILQGYPRCFREVNPFPKKDKSHTSMPDKECRSAQIQNQIWAGSMICLLLMPTGAVIYRVPQDPKMDESLRVDDTLERDRLQEKFKSNKPMVLLNATNAVDGSSIKILANIFRRLDALLHVLFWSESECQLIDCCLFDNSPTTDADNKKILQISLVELSRLRLSFQPKKDSFGIVRMFCLNESGLFLSSETESSCEVAQQMCARYMLDIRSAIWPQNDQNEMFLLLPNFPIQRRKVDEFPLTAEYDPNHAYFDQWCSAFPTRYYIYPMHTSGVMLRPSSLASRLYLIYLCLNIHRYEDAAIQISSSFSDTSLTADESLLTDWIFDFVQRSDVTRLQPDALACILRVAVICLSSGAEPKGINLRDCYDRYRSTLGSISLVCQLSQPDRGVLERKLNLNYSGDTPLSSQGLDTGSLRRNMFRVFQQCMKTLNAGPPAEVPHALEVTKRSDDSCDLTWKIGCSTMDAKGNNKDANLTDFRKLQDAFLADMHVPQILGVNVEICDTTDESWRLLLPKNLQHAQEQSGVVQLVGMHPALEHVGLSTAKVIGLSPQKTFRVRVRVVNRIGTGPPSEDREVPREIKEEEKALHKGNIENDERKFHVFGQLPFFKYTYSRPGVLPGQHCVGLISGADTFDLFHKIVTGYSPPGEATSFFLLFYEIAIGKVRVGLDVQQDPLQHSYSTRVAPTMDFVTSGWKCAVCSENNFLHAPSCIRCDKEYLYHSTEDSGMLENFQVNYIKCDTREHRIQLSYMQLLLKSMILRNTSHGQNPLILSKDAFELTLLNIIIEALLVRGDLQLP